MTDNKDKEDVVVNLFKDKDEHIMTRCSSTNTNGTLYKLVIDQIDRVKDDADKHKVVGIRGVV